MRQERIDASQMELLEKVVSIKRVTKVVKGGRNFRFTALVVVGDGNGHVGAGLGKATEIPEAIRKGKEDAMKKMIEITFDENGSITHDVLGKFGSASVLLKKAPDGTGVIAGGPARAVIEMAGIKNIRTKSLGSNNKQNVVLATNEGKQKREDQSVEQAVANAEMDIPEAMISFQSRQMVDDFARRIMQQGMTMEQYFQFTGLSEEKMMEEFKPEAEKRIRTRLTLEAIVAAENIEVSEERLDEELQKMADSYKMEVDKLKEYMGENEKKQMKEDIAIQEAVTLIANAAVEG